MSDASGTGYTKEHTKTKSFSVTSEAKRQLKVAAIYWQAKVLKPRSQSYNIGWEVAKFLRATKSKELKLGT